jgi:hypothetical protein
MSNRLQRYFAFASFFFFFLSLNSDYTELPVGHFTSSRRDLPLPQPVQSNMEKMTDMLEDDYSPGRKIPS